MYGDGKGFVPDRLTNGKVVILAQNPGDNEEKGLRIVGWSGRRTPVVEPCSPQPLVGATGYEMEQHYLPLAGLQREEVSLCNIIKCRWVNNGKRTNQLPDVDVLRTVVEYCTKSHLRLPLTATAVVAFGDEAWKFTQGPHYPLNEWRGFLGPRTFQGRPVYAVVHLAAILRAPASRVVAKHDWKRLGRLVRGEWPADLPTRLVVTDPIQCDEMVLAFDRAREAPFVVIDTEYVPDEYLLRICGLGWRHQGQIEGLQINWLNGTCGSEARATFARELRRLCKSTPIVSQNFKDAELPCLEKTFGITASDYLQVEDAMQMHAVRWSEMEHDLEFLASIMGKHTKLKHLQEQDELLYNWGDVIETLVIYEKLYKEMQADPQSYHVYKTQNMPLLPILHRREQRGLRLNQAFIESQIPDIEARRQAACAMAESYTGLRINLGSPGVTGQVIRFLNTFEGHNIKSIDDDIISDWRGRFAPFDALYEQKEGLNVEYITRRIEHEGAHPLLECRAMFAKDQQLLSHYLYPLRGKQRCYPRISIHSQATGRHSTTDPPLATLPSKLRSVVLPDKGTVWIGGDYDQQELRIFAAEARDEAFLQAFKEGYDIHTLNTCDLFELQRPPDLRDPHKQASCQAWRDSVAWGLGADSPKDDVRRVFAKRFVYRLVYFAVAGLAHTIPGAKALGIQDKEIDSRAVVYLQKHPAIPAYRRRVEALAATVGETRSWAGRRRACFKGREEAIRALGNHPMQGGGADILNLTVIQVSRELPFALYAFGMHDSFYFEVPVAQATDDTIRHIYRIASQPRRINGLDVEFPLAMKVIDDQGVQRDWKA